MKRIALIGDYNPEIAAHQAIPKALEISSRTLKVQFNFDWINTETIQDIEETMNTYSGIWTVPGSPYRNVEGVLNTIKYSREKSIPFLGTCGGFQHALIEFFRNVMGYNLADSLENNPDSGFPVISPLSCSLVGSEGKVFLKGDGKVRRLFKDLFIVEKYHCNYGFNSIYIDLLKKSKLKISGVDTNNEIRIVELEEHPYFVATLFQPERSALTGKDHPIINSFVDAAVNS